MLEHEITRRVRGLLQSQQDALARAEDSLAALRAQIEAEERKDSSIATSAACPLAVSSTTFDEVAPCFMSEGDAVTNAAAYRDGRPPTNAVQATRHYGARVLTTIQRAASTDLFDDVCLRDRTAARLWESWRSLALESGTTSGAEVASLDSFVSCLTKMDLPEVSLPARSRLTGGFETFLCDVLNIQVSISTNFFTTPTPLFWKGLSDEAVGQQTVLVRPDRIVRVQDAMGGPHWDLKASDSRLPDRAFVRSDLWEPDTFAPLEAFLRSDGRCLFVLHETTASVGWSAWLQRMVNKGKATVFAGCDRLKMRSYLDRPNGSEKWTWYKGLWEMWVVRLNNFGPNKGVDQRQFPFACQGIFGRLKLWDPNAFWSPLSEEPPPPNFQPSADEDRDDDGEGQGFMNPLDRSVSRIDCVPVQSCSQKSEKEVRSNGTPSAWQRVQTFWANWDKEVQERSFLCAQNPIDGGAVERSLRRPNSLLATSPDARLRRIARLAKLPADTPLSTDQIVIYAMLGPWSPYIG